MPRVRSRPIEEVAWDLRELLKWGPRIMSITQACQSSSTARHVEEVISGCFELLVAELLSNRLGLEEVVYDERITPPCIYWNGTISDGLPRRAGEGHADIEVYIGEGECTIVDVTLSSRKEILTSEVRRLRAHRPSILMRCIKRLLVAPRTIKAEGVEVAEIGSLIEGVKPVKPKVSYWDNIKSMLKSIALGLNPRK